MIRISLRIIAASVALALVAGCSGEPAKHLEPLSYQMKARMTLRGMEAESPILLRLFKEESELEIWKRGSNGEYAHLKTYPICQWSGVLGPKLKEGDRQAPEGFYTIRPAQMNPLSNYYLSFNIGFPNSYDRAFGRTGSNLMVHGACSSAGCYSMTDDYIAEIYALAREAFDGGQQEFQLQAFPFRMTEENMQRHKGNPWYDFWVNLKQGYDAFETAKLPPKVDVCGKRYVFNASFTVPDSRIDPTAPCPAYVALSAPPSQAEPAARSDKRATRASEPAAAPVRRASLPSPSADAPAAPRSSDPASAINASRPTAAPQNRIGPLY